MELYRKYRVQEDSSGMLRMMMKPLQLWKAMTSEFFNTEAAKDRPIIPADFLIDSDQRIAKVHYGKDFGDHLPLEQITEWAGKS